MGLGMKLVNSSRQTNLEPVSPILHGVDMFLYYLLCNIGYQGCSD